MKTRLALAMSLLWLAATPRAHAEEAFVHTVRSGETLASIAQRYYGDPRRESILVAENGLTAQGGADIVVGLRLHIPWSNYHRVGPGETWAKLAERFYGDARRAFVLQDSNRTGTEQPPEGAELLIPYPVRHITAQSDTLTRIAGLYYADEDEGARTLRRFNGLRGNRVNRGQVVLVPLAALGLSEEGRNLIAAQLGEAPAAGEVRALQQVIEQQLPTLRALVLDGAFTEAVALGNRLLGAGELTGNQVVSISREIGTAYVALGQERLAVEAFRAALARQPDFTMDSRDTSPIVLRALERARQPAASPRRPKPAETDEDDE